MVDIHYVLLTFSTKLLCWYNFTNKGYVWWKVETASFLTVISFTVLRAVVVNYST